MPFWAYMLHCNAGRFYTGHTDNLEQRIAQHKGGSFEGFTKRFLPVELVWSQEFPSRDEAKAAEKRIKGWSRAKKLALIRGDWALISRLAKGKSSPSTSSGQAEVEIVAEVHAALIAAARAAHPLEACGVLLGRGDRITAAVPAANVHPSPHTHFEIDPAVLIAAHRAARAPGACQVIGYYHSHPHGPAAPSPTDQAMAAGDGRIWAIIAGEEVQCWRDSTDGFAPLSFTIIES
jgi:predicted GIY-YIG superfamily endonuclease/proteasome lid subunit RPN8/RPN11